MERAFRLFNPPAKPAKQLVHVYDNTVVISLLINRVLLSKAPRRRQVESEILDYYARLDVDETGRNWG